MKRCYQASAFAAILVGLAVYEGLVAIPSRRPAAVATLGSAACLLLMNIGWGIQAIEQYAAAQREMHRIVVQIAAIGTSRVSQGIEVVFVPDAIGRVPFGRNAQAGLMLPPVQKQSLTDRIFVQTDAEFAAMQAYLNRGLFSILK